MIHQILFFGLFSILLLGYNAFPTQSVEETTVPLQVFKLLKQSADWIAPAASYCAPHYLTFPFDCASCTHAGDLKLIKAFSTETWTHVIGYVAVDEQNQRVIMALRGTDLFSTNVLTDLMLIQTEYKNKDCNECYVHLGFYRAWRKTLEDIDGIVTQVLNETGYEFFIVGHSLVTQVLNETGYEFFIVGHSLGGAIATLAGIHFYDQGHVPIVVTMGSPRVGNQNFADYVDERLGERFYRVTIFQDPVPQVPPVQFGYRHCGQEIYIKNETLPTKQRNLVKCNGQEDMECSAGMDFIFWELFRVHLLKYFRQLNKPTIEIKLDHSPNLVGYTSSRGNRQGNEDSQQFGVLDLPSSPLYFGIFDGHGGRKCVDHILQTLPQTLETAQKDDIEPTISSFRQIGGYFCRFKPFISKSSQFDWKERVYLSFLITDYTFWENNTSDISGSCASVGIINSDNGAFWEGGELIVGHVGDTKIILCDKDGRAKTLTHPHHPDSQIESSRLRRFCSVYVDPFGEERLFGVLANTRSFGDIRQKKLGVTAEPELITVSDLQDYAFMVMYTDGIGDVLSDQEVVDIVKHAASPQEASSRVVKFAERVGTEDNSTCLVVRLKRWGLPTKDFSKAKRDFRVKDREPAPRRQ
ncbi:Protein phosphatase 2C 4 [Neolecta irregularis DAH-3]|uniref:Protein phosphatase 2C 4 n=1 Tax=Neolecta irregularis (strain DAH-3) TaxID=1198029 RepID=A0A1U7LIC3_NEOID|nr:Protein phosphatase 2C 4 [Neolecta irregularis DAH-3]|eukprot:OLL22394.1 Protein phosphatase 2C 4 [Neolecta irregularis DAH-3]